MMAATGSGDVMRVVLLGFTASFCLMASPGFAQSAWQYDRNGIDGPTASVSDGAYKLGGLCMDDTRYFFADFPRDIMPKMEEAEVRIKFTTDVSETQESFSVLFVTNEWEVVDDYASVWFYGTAADDWIEKMAAAQTNVFIALETSEASPDLIFQKWFSARGSTAALRALAAACGQ